MQFDSNSIDWLAIRQSLSLSLLKVRDVKITHGSSYLEKNSEYLPLFNDISKLAIDLGIGEIKRESGSLIYSPEPVSYGSFNINSITCFDRLFDK